MTKLMTEIELCEVLKVCRPFLYESRKQGLPYIRLGDKLIRYDLDQVMTWFNEYEKAVN